MKRIFKLLFIALIISSLAGITTSCVIFQEPTHATKPTTFKHKKALPKKYVINNGYKPIAK
jgi:hypothetical protein